jgi:hypothetical protein
MRIRDRLLLLALGAAACGSPDPQSIAVSLDYDSLSCGTDDPSLILLECPTLFAVHVVEAGAALASGCTSVAVDVMRTADALPGILQRIELQSVAGDRVVNIEVYAFDLASPVEGCPRDPFYAYLTGSSDSIRLEDEPHPRVVVQCDATYPPSCF